MDRKEKIGIVFLVLANLFQILGQISGSLYISIIYGYEGFGGVLNPSLQTVNQIFSTVIISLIPVFISAIFLILGFIYTREANIDVDIGIIGGVILLIIFVLIAIIAPLHIIVSPYTFRLGPLTISNNSRIYVELISAMFTAYAISILLVGIDYFRLGRRYKSALLKVGGIITSLAILGPLSPIFLFLSGIINILGLIRKILSH
ncbi:DUF973 family protein [Sulfolobus sp. S-194]|uniref:DUF973 family protein n=1 Tax=Sulfolobus sp. S-194 TaxID=2512240 RepID=UPI001436D8E5|nr:DUF973 family protein [Sulfolobus sp. S-194]QIW22789.1 DUF973 family protein [Sulfolobus sp. S-194]